MQTESKIHNIVLGVSILSSSRSHVKSGKTKYDAAKPINLADHASPVSSKTNFVAYQKHKPTGIEYNITATAGLSRHHSHTN
jgi:hypothetical protein